MIEFVVGRIYEKDAIIVVCYGVVKYGIVRKKNRDKGVKPYAMPAISYVVTRYAELKEDPKSKMPEKLLFVMVFPEIVLFEAF